MSFWNRHKIFEKNSIILIAGILVVIAIGGLVEITPLFYLKSTIEKVDGMRPYTPLELAGHLQQMRANRMETMVTGQRLYQLVRQKGPITDCTFEIRFLDPGVQAYAFTLVTDQYPPFSLR